jgi:hypothetical protein
MLVAGRASARGESEGAMRYALLALLVLLGESTPAADDVTYRLMKLEQDVRNLERQVQTLTRQLDEQRQLSRTGDRSSAAPSAREPAAAGSTAWLEAARWNRVRNGMSELEVIDVLGPPTAMREAEGKQVLLYAMEIGSSGFLGGSVEFREGAVTAINKPVLR